jgi:hypothetical protein
MKRKMKLISAPRPVSDPPTYEPIGWPLGFNPSMDQHAHFHGVTHWSCAAPTENRFWMRRDGELIQARFAGPDGYLSDLRDFDRRIPMREPLPLFAGARREKKAK